MKSELEVLRNMWAEYSMFAMSSHDLNCDRHLCLLDALIEEKFDKLLAEVK